MTSINNNLKYDNDEEKIIYVDDFINDDEENDDDENNEDNDEVLIRNQIVTTNISSVYNQYLQENNIILKPEYQRDLCWSFEKMNALIDTIMRNWIIPNYVIYKLSKNELREQKTETEYYYECIDGQHRLTALKWFMENKMDIKTGKYVYWKHDNMRVFYNLDVNKLAEIKRKKINCRNMTKEEKVKFNNYSMSIYIIECDGGLPFGTKCDIFNRLQNGEKVNSYEKLKNMYKNVIIDNIRSYKLTDYIKDINFINKIMFKDKKQPRKIESFTIYFLIRTILIIDKQSLDINYLDLNIKKYLEANDNKGTSSVQLINNISDIYPKVNEILNWIATNINIDKQILPELAYIYICIYAKYGIEKLNTLVLLFNRDKNNKLFAKLNNINSYKKSYDKVTSSEKMNEFFTEVIKNISNDKILNNNEESVIKKVKKINATIHN